MKKIIFIFSFVALVLGLWAGNYFWPAQESEPAYGLYTGPKGGDFTLQSQQGPVTLSDYKGKVTLLYFGYTYCPDACPTALASIGNAFKQLSPEELDQVQGILISVDPDRDTPKKLAEYTKFFHPKIIGVTGTKEQVDKVCEQYNIKYEVAKESTAAGYLVNHTSLIIVLDKSGGIRETMAHAVSVAGIKGLIQELIAEPSE